MSWIEEIDENKASGDLRKVYESIGSARGKVSNIMKVHSLNPGAMQRHLELYTHLLFGASGLTRAEREAIALAVSAANGCAYCVNHHREALEALERRAGAMGGEAQPRQTAMRAYVEKLTR